ncbi:MAG: TIGR01459 family HAD-type hydrolase [Acetobacteraceae bacterium]|nr:TIGR01459 family HAD-type hydrolase [Acetobacteraceae bacterium]
MKHFSGFAPLAEHYDGFILDLWGVIHDGINPLPGAVNTLMRMKTMGKRSVLLSNAPRRAWATQALMRNMGIGDDLYDGILTSGEAVWLALRARPDNWWEELGHRVFHLGPERDRNVMDDLGLTVVDSPAAASFVLNTGPDDLRDPTSLTEFENLLRACLAARLPMVCGNPDMAVIRGGTRIMCAGALAERYVELGGNCRMLGKPDPAIYGPVLEMLGVAKPRVLAVGDALATDISGASRVGIDSCWVLGGIHLAATGGDMALAEVEARAQGLAPVAIMPSFRW